ncbi:hypothetical protein BT96DRAFT_1002731 [Gymnopus androsaceus JB14]|uniref:Uncharacterized protein n=1 Tax=Gymnopus androsaceus JB14 TaxID=1447944 RepID=A0A6A4GVS5_9AGAR|nr:hypothetical protein BT96DRAFT_1002731 [Gymnopus androsaceus JB14]
MPNAEPSNTPPPAYTPDIPPATTALVRFLHKLVPLVNQLQRREREFEKQVTKHGSNFIGSAVVNKWRKDTSEAILALIEAGTVPFQNIQLTEGRKNSNLTVSSTSW